MDKRVVLVAFNGEPMCFAHVLLNTRDHGEPRVKTILYRREDISRQGVKGVKDAKIRQSGPFRMIKCNIATVPMVSVCKAHELADKIEDLIPTGYGQTESVFVHIEPYSRIPYRHYAGRGDQWSGVKDPWPLRQGAVLHHTKTGPKGRLLLA